ncbi:MAG: TolC family outer membrane protein [Paracoccus sp. (in: a-proteobacteria)]|nr:TolC family outer membrane protein [Paracoccus sp. (in: a-proteobacteria)]
MIRIRHFAGVAVAGMIALAATVPARAETLADAMVAAYRHSALMDQNRAVLRAADEDVAAAAAALRPVIQWVAGHTYRYIEGGTEQNTSTLSLSAQMTLFDFGRSQLAIDIAKETVLATREALVGIEQDVILGATEAYFNVWAAREQVALQANSVRVLAQERQAAQDRFDVGEITVTDVSLADAQLAATRARLASAEGDLATAEERYLAATGRRPGRFGAPPASPRLPESVEAARGVAQRTHPSIRQLQRQAAAAELGVAAAAAERNPTVTGSVGLSSQDGPTGFGFNTTTSGATVGVEMSQTIYSGGRLPSAHRKAMAQRDQVRAALLNSARSVSQSVGTTWSYIEVVKAQIRAIDQQILAAQQAYDGVREEAMLGARTTLDVLDAEQSLLSARADRISAQANLQLAHYQLLAAMGLLTVENLKLGIPTYDPSEYYKAVREAPYTSRQGENLDRVLRAIGRN